MSVLYEPVAPTSFDTAEVVYEFALVSLLVVSLKLEWKV